MFEQPWVGRLFERNLIPAKPWVTVEMAISAQGPMNLDQEGYSSLASCSPASGIRYTR